jgi:RNA polymerase sigma-70 factor (ECF subfamily)
MPHFQSGESTRNCNPEPQQGGSDESQANVYIRLAQPHMAAMLHVATALVGPADAEDAAQEALLRGMRSWGTLRDVGALRTWLLRITYRVCSDWRRGRFGTRRCLTEPLPDDDELLAMAALGDDPGSSDHAAMLDLYNAINHLDAGLRVIVLLRYNANLDATEIGAMLHLPSSTVRTRLRRALALLRKDPHITWDVSISQTKKGEQ